MRQFRRRAYFLALTLPLVSGGAANAEIRWELVTPNKNKSEDIWVNAKRGKTEKLKPYKSVSYGLSTINPGKTSLSNSNPKKAIKANKTGNLLDKYQEKYLANSNPRETASPQSSEELRNIFQKTDIADRKDNKEIAENEDLVLISEVVITGLESHPEKVRLEYAAYDAMTVRPGSRVSKSELKRDLNAIFTTGWFSGLEIEAIDTALGVKLIVDVKPNPVFTEVIVNPEDSLITKKALKDIFKTDFGKTLNLNVLKLRMNKLKEWYSERGYSLARISGPNRVTSNGKVQLEVQEGTIEDIKVIFLDDEGNSVKENGKPIRGKTKTWVINRELLSKPGAIFNRKNLEADIKRLYGLALFSDIKVSLKPVTGEPGKIEIILGITEQRTGSLTGGIGWSGSQGFFGSAGLQEKNLLGRSWSSDINFTYGEYGALISFSLTDPWIKGDKHRTSFRTSVFISRDVPQEFRSSKGHILGVSDYAQGTGSSPGSRVYDIDFAHSGVNNSAFSSVSAAKASDSNTSWFDYEGDSVLLHRTGGNFSFSRPLNGGNPYKKATWSVLLGMDFQKVKPIDYSAQDRPYGAKAINVVNNTALNNDVICIAFNCAKENTLVGFRGGMSRNKLNNPRNPTSGTFLSIGTEQYISVGENSPTFNRAKATYSYFIPINWLKLHKGCKPKAGEDLACPQTLAFQLKGGSIVGDLPPYEAFCLGGSKSIRGWSACDLAVAKRYGEASVEYRVPVWRMVSANVFVDAGTDFGSQADVPGNPGGLLHKKGKGFSVGSGLSFNTPVGPLRIEAASQDLEGDWRYNVGFGWKF
ncbi:BamA/TamA family outer membrane protein [Prochlorococcus sp. MIT 0603]